MIRRMRNGRLVEVVATQGIFANPQHPYAKALVAAVPTPAWQDADMETA
jgi:ABC-type oligopeptide transport system ATPase subunit